MGLFQRLFGIRMPDGTPLPEQEQKALYKECIRIAWPSTLEGVLMSTISSIDTMMVGTLGSAAIAAVGLTLQPRMVLLIVAQALCVSTTALCAHRKGAGNHEGANACLMQSLCVITGLGILMTLLGFFCAPWIMLISGANEDTLALSTDYFRIISLGMIFNCWSLCICASMRAIGKTRITLATNLTSNLVNVCLNYMLIGGHFGFPALGVRGAAIATLSGTVVSSFLAIGAVLHHNGYYHFTRPKFDRATLSSLAKIGSSSILESAFMRIGFLVNARLIAGTGTAAFASYQIVQQVTSLSFTLGDGAATAGTSLIGQSLGAGRKDLAQVNVSIVRRIGVVLSLGLMVLIFLLRRQFALLFTREEDIVFSASLCFLVAIVGMLPQNGRVIYSGCLRGAGDVKYVAICALVSVAILRPILTYLFCYPLDAALPGKYIAVMGPWIAFVIDAFVRDGLLTARIRKGKWMDIQLL